MNGRILVDARLPWGSGIGRYVRNIVPLVAKHMSHKHFTLLVAPGDIERAEDAIANCANITVLATTIKPFSLGEQTGLAALADDHELTWFTNYWVPLRWRGRFVATVHDLIHLDPRFPASVVKRFAASRTFAKVRRDAEHVIFVSRFSARVFTADIGMPRASSVVHHGIDHAGIGIRGNTASERSRIALVVAAAKEHKNLPLMLEAWKQADLTDWQLAIVTPNDDLRSSIDLVEQAGRIGNVQIHRGISDDALSALYANAGFALVPSRYEGFGLPLLEAMRAGTPVVSSTADALVEVASGALIPFVDPDDREGWVQAICDMASKCGPTNEWQQGISRHNRVIADSFTWSKAAILTAGILNATPIQ